MERLDDAVSCVEHGDEHLAVSVALCAVCIENFTEGRGRRLETRVSGVHLREEEETDLLEVVPHGSEEVVHLRV